MTPNLGGNAGASAYSIEERERRKALLISNNACSRCDAVAWSLSLEAQMQLRPRRSDPTQKELLCGQCCRRQDAKAIDPSNMSNRLASRVRKERKANRRKRRRPA